MIGKKKVLYLVISGIFEGFFFLFGLQTCDSWRRSTHALGNRTGRVCVHIVDEDLDWEDSKVIEG